MTEPATAGGIPATAWKSLRFLTFYRLVLTGLLTVLYFSLAEVNPFGVSEPVLFPATLLTYLAFSVAAGFTARLHWPGYRLQALAQVFVDIAAIAVLMHASGGVTSGLSVLLVVAVATGALLLPGRIAFLFAAVATLALLAESGLSQLVPDKASASDITRAGLLGLVLFAAAGLAHMLATRLRESEALATRRGIDLANLEQLNRHIIQTLQSGVLIVDANGRIRLSNATADRLLGAAAAGRRLADLAPALAHQLELWQKDPGWVPEHIRSAGADEAALIPRFSALQTAQGTGAIVFLDDSARLAQQSQQIRLASLGRLTASIAHEIRNPLGAISHAAQLLSESDTLDRADARLTEIIDNHTRRVNDIIENVLQLSRGAPAVSRELRLKPWLDEFLFELVQAERFDLTRIHVRIEPEDLSLHIDPGHLQQILWNLCQNAIRHAGDPPELRIEARVGEGGAIHLDVIDNGPGIPDDIAAQIFEPFYTTASSGTGLGLYIARELCALNECQIRYRRLPAGGSCFRLHFAGR